MKNKRRCFLGLALVLPVALVLIALVSLQSASADTDAAIPHRFDGVTVTIAGSPAADGLLVQAVEAGTTPPDGGKVDTGAQNPVSTAGGAFSGLLAQGEDLEGPPHGDYIEFYVYISGVPEGAEQADCRAWNPLEEEWSAWLEPCMIPWRSEGYTMLDLKANEPGGGVTYTLRVESAGCCTVTVDGGTYVIGPDSYDDVVLSEGSHTVEAIDGTECCIWQEWRDAFDVAITDTNPYQFDLGGDMTLKAVCETPGPFDLTVNQVEYYSGDPPVRDLVILDPDGGVYDCCTYVTATAVMDDPEYKFIGWDADFPLAITDTESITTHMIADREITATFAIQAAEFPLTVTSQEESVGRTACYSINVTGVMTPGIVAPGEVGEFVALAGVSVTLTAFDGDCCGFAGWWDNGVFMGDDLTYTYDPFGEHDVVAQSYEPPFWLFANPDPAEGGTVTADPDSPPPTGYGCNDVVTVTADENYDPDHWLFAGWLGDDIAGSINPIEQITMTEDKVVTGTFELETFTVTIDIEPVDGGTVTETEETEDDEYEWGETITLTAEPADCYDFVEWTGLPAGIPTDTLTVVFTVSGELDIAAVFARDETLYDLTVNVDNADPGVIGAVNPPSGTYTCCTYVTLTPSANIPYTVTWSGHPDVEGLSSTHDAGTGDPVTIHILDGNVVVTATFEDARIGPPVPCFTLVAAEAVTTTPLAMHVFEFTLTNNDCGDGSMFDLVSTDSMWDMGSSWTALSMDSVVLDDGASEDLVLTMTVHPNVTNWVTGTTIVTATGATDVVTSAFEIWIGGLCEDGDCRCCRYDINCSGDIDILDIQRVAGKWPLQKGDPGFVPFYDYNLNDEIDILDIQRVAGKWPQACPAPP